MLYTLFTGHLSKLRLLWQRLRNYLNREEKEEIITKR